jgi:hypothetical protein
MKDARHSDSTSKEYLATKEYLMVPPQAIIMKDGRTVAVDARAGGAAGWGAYRGVRTGAVPSSSWTGRVHGVRVPMPALRHLGEGLQVTGVQVRGG